MVFRNLPFTVAVTACACCAVAGAQETHRGRHYTPPPVTTHIAVHVTKGYNGKPIENAEVIFHPLKDGKDTGAMELKTNQDGIAEIDMIPQDSTVRLQVIAQGFRTYGQDYQIHGDSQDISVAMAKPVAQYSAYQGQSQVAPPKPAEEHPLAPVPPASSEAPASTPR